MSDKEKKPEPKPVCPYCRTEMKPVKYVGYYDEFHCWWCECSELPGVTEQRGQYA